MWWVSPSIQSKLRHSRQTQSEEVGSILSHSLDCFGWPEKTSFANASFNLMLFAIVVNDGNGDEYFLLGSLLLY